MTDELTELATTQKMPSCALNRDFKAESNEMLTLYAGIKNLTGWVGHSPQEMDWLKTVRKFFFDRRQSLPPQLVLDLTAFTGNVVEAIVVGIPGAGMT